MLCSYNNVVGHEICADDVVDFKYCKCGNCATTEKRPIAHHVCCKQIGGKAADACKSAMSTLEANVCITSHEFWTSIVSVRVSVFCTWLD